MGCEPSNCGFDGLQFKGVFARHLAYNYKALAAARPALVPVMQRFALANSDSMVAHDIHAVSADEDQFGSQWRGPFVAPSAGPSPAQGSALDLMNAAFWILGDGNAPGFASSF